MRGLGGADRVELLAEWDDRLPWHQTKGALKSTEVLRGNDETGLLVVSASSPSVPSKADLHALWKARSGGSGSPVLVVVEYGHPQHRLALFGLDEDAVPVTDVDWSIGERLIGDALNAVSPAGLVQEMRRRLGTLASGGASGVRNEGLFASHVLEQEPRGPHWSALTAAARPLLAKRGSGLLEGIGYSLEVVPDGTVLRERTGGHRRAAAVLLTDDESLDNPLSRFHGTTAVQHGLAVAARENVPWLIVLGGPLIRLYPVDPDIGVGRKGQTQTFAEVDLSLLSQGDAGYLALLFAPDALVSEGHVARLLRDSLHFAAGLSQRLRERIYRDVIPTLAVAVADRTGAARRLPGEQRAGLDDAYHQSMIILFRLLFVAYAEDRRLLPFGSNDAYTANALKTLALRILDRPDAPFSPVSTSMWSDVTQIWQVIDTGDLEEMGVPAYNGGLFTADKDKNLLGAAIYDLRLTNATMGPVLQGMLLDVTTDGMIGPVDFRSLDVREFGTIYEGLLESRLDIATADLALDQADQYIPAAKGSKPAVREGEVFFQSRSGSRKASGSYFTKPFAVQHLLDQALEPSISAHLERIAAMLHKGATHSAAAALFDFRVADLSMGSGHFLVAAIDRIEARFSAFLAENPMPEVAAELHTLRTQAATQSGIPVQQAAVDDGVLLRRQIARRCLYGVDVNEIAVELARLAVWIHTFVPGLPLSFLDHGLIHGNSLTGVGTTTEITEALEQAEQRELAGRQATTGLLLDAALSDYLARVQEHLESLGSLADASIADIALAAQHQRSINTELDPLDALCDLITAERTTRHLKPSDPEKIKLSAGGGALFAVTTAEALEAAVLKHPHLDRARRIADDVQAAHLLIRFPEVFHRDPPGFDTVLGNPPWENLHVNSESWWTLRFPGLSSMPQQTKNAAIERHTASRPDLAQELEREISATQLAARIIAAGPYPGIGEAHIDLFAAFCWRFWQEARDQGRIGVVLPRTAVAGASAAQWRKTIYATGTIADATAMTNTGRWAFDMEPRYTIVLLTVVKRDAAHTVTLRGPYASLDEYDEGMAEGADAQATVAGSTILGWSESGALPLVPAKQIDVFAAMKHHPPFGSDVGDWRFRPVQGDMNTTKEKHFFDFNLEKPARGHTLEVWTGGSFNLWNPDHGLPYAYARPDEVDQYLMDKRRNQARLKRSAFYGLNESELSDPNALPYRKARIAFRDVARATDSRTMICCLVPPGIALVHKAPFLVRKSSGVRDEAYLLGVMSSLPFDWYARRYVEIAMTFELLSTFPVPRVESGTGARKGVEGHSLNAVDVRPLSGRLIEATGMLAAVDDRFADWAAEVGVQVGSARDPNVKQDLIEEADALVGLLYGLSEEQMVKVFATFHRGWDYRPALERVLKHYRHWAEQVPGAGVAG